MININPFDYAPDYSDLVANSNRLLDLLVERQRRDTEARDEDGGGAVLAAIIYPKRRKYRRAKRP